MNTDFSKKHQTPSTNIQRSKLQILKTRTRTIKKRTGSTVFVCFVFRGLKKEIPHSAFQGSPTSIPLSRIWHISRSKILFPVFIRPRGYRREICFCHVGLDTSRPLRSKTRKSLVCKAALRSGFFCHCPASEAVPPSFHFGATSGFSLRIANS